VALNVYRSCKSTEKRKVLQVFWIRGVEVPARIEVAAAQYGLWALACCIVLAIEPIPVIIVSLSHNGFLAGVAIAIELVLVLSAWWAAVRTRELRRKTDRIAAPGGEVVTLRRL
jgi:hypothetical protein